MDGDAVQPLGDRIGCRRLDRRRRSGGCRGLAHDLPFISNANKSGGRAMALASDLFAAIQSGDAAGVRRLVTETPALAGACSDDGLPALLFALYRTQRESVDALLAASPELDIFSAAALGREAELDALLAQSPELASAFSADGFTALHLAAFFGRAGAARRLLDAGAAVNAVAHNPMLVQPLHS